MSYEVCSFDDLPQVLQKCQCCPLYAGRQQAVLGYGNASSPIMFVGEAPGHDEDIQGKPFVGASGQLLTAMLAAIGISRDNVYISNVVKCRPPNNRQPDNAEINACLYVLRSEVWHIRPKIIVCLGATAANALISADVRIMRDHGTWYNKKGVWFLPTFHPSALLRDTSKKRLAWGDLQQIRAKLDELNISI